MSVPAPLLWVLILGSAAYARQVSQTAAPTPKRNAPCDTRWMNEAFSYPAHTKGKRDIPYRAPTDPAQSTSPSQKWKQQLSEPYPPQAENKNSGVGAFANSEGWSHAEMWSRFDFYKSTTGGENEYKPVLLFLHGGGNHSGNRKTAFQLPIKRFTDRGIHVAMFDVDLNRGYDPASGPYGSKGACDGTSNGYGCAGDDGFGIGEAEMAAQYRQLIQFLRDNKDCFCINADAVFGSGGSAGAILTGYLLRDQSHPGNPNGAILHQVLTNIYGVGTPVAIQQEDGMFGPNVANFEAAKAAVAAQDAEDVLLRGSLGAGNELAIPLLFIGGIFDGTTPSPLYCNAAEPCNGNIHAIGHVRDFLDNYLPSEPCPNADCVAPGGEITAVFNGAVNGNADAWSVLEANPNGDPLFLYYMNLGGAVIVPSASPEPLGAADQVISQWILDRTPPPPGLGSAAK